MSVRQRLDALHSERGTTVPLYVLFVLVLIGMLTVVTDATQVFIYQRSLHSIADGASLAGADGIDDSSIYQHGIPGSTVQLGEVQASAAVAKYMTEVKANQPNVTCGVDGVDQNEARVTVTCHGSATLPILNWAVPGGGASVPVKSTASARAFAQ